MKILEMVCRSKPFASLSQVLLNKNEIDTCSLSISKSLCRNINMNYLKFGGFGKKQSNFDIRYSLPRYAIHQAENLSNFPGSLVPGSR